MPQGELQLHGAAPAPPGGKAGQLFIAEKQTAGRGRDGKIWLQSDLSASFLWTARDVPSKTFLAEEEPAFGAASADLSDKTEAFKKNKTGGRRAAEEINFSLNKAEEEAAAAKKELKKSAGAAPRQAPSLSETSRGSMGCASDLPEEFAEDLQSAAAAAWPSSALEAKGNDLMRKGKKIAGILLELLEMDKIPAESGAARSGAAGRRREKALIAGLGMNVFSHPPSVGAGRLTDKGRPAEKEWRLFLSRLNSLWSRRAARFLAKQ